MSVMIFGRPEPILKCRGEPTANGSFMLACMCTWSTCWRFKEGNICFWKFCWKRISYFNVLNAKCQSWFLVGLNQLIWSVERSLQSVGSFMLAWFTWITCWRFKEVNLCFWKFCWKRIFYFNVLNYYVMCKKQAGVKYYQLQKLEAKKSRVFKPENSWLGVFWTASKSLMQVNS